jgi:hypothetical protein
MVSLPDARPSRHRAHRGYTCRYGVGLMTPANACVSTHDWRGYGIGLMSSAQACVGTHEHLAGDLPRLCAPVGSNVVWFLLST